MSILLSKKLKTLSESATIRLNAEAKALRDKGVHVINLTVGELDFDTPLHIQKGVAKNLQMNKYTPTLGLLELRKKIAQDASDRYRWPVSPENVAVTAGAKQALYNIFQIICNREDEVIIPTPSWVSYEHQVTLAGAKVVFVPLTDHFDLDVRAITKALTSKTKAIILNSPHNPTGAIFSKQALSALAKVLRSRDVFVIADDIYNTLVYTTTYRPISDFFKDKSKLIVINGFSKSHALTGWRIGYLIAPKVIIEANNKFQSHASGNTSVPSQLGALESYKKNITPQYLRILSRRKALVEKLLRKIPGISFVSPLGAFYFFININKIEKNAIAFCEKLLKERHVAVVPGEAFHLPGYVRLSFACDEKSLSVALKKLHEFIKRYH